MNFDYKLLDMELELFAGRLNKDKELVEEVNKLYWIDSNENFFDMNKFAGEGNIGHMLKHIELNLDSIQNVEPIKQVLFCIYNVFGFT